MRLWAAAIVGPTATGKTAAGVALCRALDGEVISMDSMQVYRTMDIGTAKPDLPERGGIAHHLLDVADPGASFSAARYRTLADAAVVEILTRQKLPVFVGGTGLYLNAVTYEMDFAGAKGDASFRAPLEEAARTEAGRLALHQWLGEVDPQAAARLHVNDSRRVIRALEIFQRTGRPMSDHVQDFTQRQRLVRPVVMGLTMPRDQLYARIDQRVLEMMRDGLWAEVQRLHQAGVPRESQAMQAIGYKELYDVLEGRAELEQAVALISKRSRHYAKRQLTWFLRDSRVRWFDVTAYSDLSTLHEAMAAHFRAEVGGEEPNGKT